jgi:hypothetical protein
MTKCWNNCAKNDGFDGVYCISAITSTGFPKENKNSIDAYYCFEPGYSTKNSTSIIYNSLYYASIFLREVRNILFNQKRLKRITSMRATNRMIVRNISALLIKHSDCIVYPGACPNWDNTPRRSYQGMVYTHDSSTDFRILLQELKHTCPNSEFIFVNAWNEWGEGCHLEPDEKNGYAYLEVIHDVGFDDN